MERVKESLRQIKEDLKKVNYNEETLTMIQENLSILELEIEENCGNSPETDREIEYLYFLEIFKRISTEREFLNGIDSEKIQTTLLAAIPGCDCPPRIKPCPRKRRASLLVNSFVERLNSREL